MKLRVSHVTRYDYDHEVSLSPHRFYLRPRETALLRLKSFSLNSSPAAKLISTRDACDNPLTWAYFWDPSPALNVRTEFEIETLDTNPFDFILLPSVVRYPFVYEESCRFSLTPYLAPPFKETQIALNNWLDEHFVDRPDQTLPLITALNQTIHASFIYRRREERGIQSSLTTLALGSGSCRDFAVLLAEMLRTLGFAARFVSGYLYTVPNSDIPAESSMHAWVEVFLPGAGWRGIDPTHGVFCDDAFIPVAHAAVAESINPIQGAYYSPTPVSSILSTNVLVEKLD